MCFIPAGTKLTYIQKIINIRISNKNTAGMMSIPVLLYIVPAEVVVPAGTGTIVPAGQSGLVLIRLRIWSI